MCDAQHRFVKRRSTCINLLESLSDWTLCIQSRHQVAIVYVDFSRPKAFDVVSHNKLTLRLHSYGVRGAVLLWIKNFLSNRTQQTRVDATLSDVSLVSGVVQGSGIGPVLFLIYINELASILESFGVHVKLFADDVKLYLQITGHRASTSVYSLTFCVRFLLPEGHQWKPAVQTAAVMLRTPPSAAGRPRPLPVCGARFWGRPPSPAGARRPRPAGRSL